MTPPLGAGESVEIGVDARKAARDTLRTTSTVPSPGDGSLILGGARPCRLVGWRKAEIPSEVPEERADGARDRRTGKRVTQAGAPDARASCAMCRQECGASELFVL
jgi:hypothetical protein